MKVVSNGCTGRRPIRLGLSSSRPAALRQLAQKGLAHFGPRRGGVE